MGSALRRMSQGNYNLGIFQDTKFVGRRFTRKFIRYRVTTTEAPGLHCSGVAVFCLEVEHFSLEALFLHGPNAVRFNLVRGK